MGSITHAKVSAKSDGGDSTLVLPSDWNAAHVISGLSSAFIGAKVYHNTTQSCNDSVILFNSEEWDTDGFHSTSSNTSRMTIPAGLGGKYLLTAVAQDQTGTLSLLFYKNGAQIQGSGAVTPSTQAVSITTIVDLAAGDYVEVLAGTGGSHTIYGAATPAWQGATFAIVKLDSGNLGNAVGCMVSETSHAAFNNGSNTYLSWDDADTYDSDGFHSTTTNPTRLTVPAGLGGRYVLTARIEVSASSSSDRRIGYRINGGTDVIYARHSYSITTIASYQSMAVVLNLNAGDYVEVFYYHNVDSITGNSKVEFFRLDGGGVNPLIDIAHARRTSGDITISSATIADVENTLDLVLTAQAGDIVEVMAQGVWENVAQQTLMDVATIVSGSPVNYVSSGGSAQANDGIPGWSKILATAAYFTITGSMMYTLQEGDISSGTVRLRLRALRGSGNVKLLAATASVPFWWGAKVHRKYT